MKIALYGAGGLGHEVAADIRRGMMSGEEWEIVGFFDDRDFSSNCEDRLMGRWLGGIDKLNEWEEDLGIVLCFGNPSTRLVVAGKIKNPCISFPNIIHNDFVITDSKSFNIGKGNVIQGKCVITTNVELGDFNLLNGGVVLAHDVETGDGNVFMPGCRVSGDVKMGNGNLIGAMSFVKQGLKIGDGITLSPLSALLTKPKDGQTYIGNPAKIFRY